MLAYIERTALDVVGAFARLGVSVWKSEPARVLAVAASAIVVVFAKLGIVVPQQEVLEALAYAVPILLGGEITRAHVTPAKKSPATK